MNGMNRILNIAILLLFLCEVGISAQSDLTRHYKTKFDEYSASSIEKLVISNRHGEIQYTGWDKDTLAVRISIWVEAPSSDIASEVHDQINIFQQPTGKTLDYRTVFKQDFFSNYNFGIDYHIFGPQELELELMNRLGNIHIEEYFGTATITGEYGHLKIAKSHEALPKAVIHLSNGDLDIGDLINAEITHKNGRFKLGSAVDLSLTTDFSNAQIQNIEQLKLTAATSNLNIGQARSVNIQAKYTELIIAKIQQKGFIESDMGSVNIQSIESDLKELTISGDHSPVQVHIANKLSFNLHGQVTNGQFFYPENKKIRILRENNTLSFSRESRSKNIQTPSLIIFNRNSDIHLIVNQ
jgi:hypothetical protein